MGVRLMAALEHVRFNQVLLYNLKKLTQEGTKVLKKNFLNKNKITKEIYSLSNLSW